MRRLANGIVFPSGYQSHAATETCPGHSTILTGSHPSRRGIIANSRFDPAVSRGPSGSYEVYCAVSVGSPDHIVGVPVALEGIFRTTPGFHGATADIAIGLLRKMGLGRGPAVDLLTIGLSATDDVGHAFGIEGAEMCLQQAALDRTVRRILSALDATHVPYVVVLTADHGGYDLPERHAEPGFPDAERLDPKFSLNAIGG